MNSKQVEKQLDLILAFAHKIPIECKYKSDLHNFIIKMEDGNGLYEYQLVPQN